MSRLVSNDTGYWENGGQNATYTRVGVGVYIDGVEMPVIPSEIEYRLPDESSRFTVLGLGDVEILQGAKLSEVRLSGIFPRHDAHFVVSGFLQPSEYITRLQKLETDGTPFRFIYTGLTCDINMEASLHDLELKEVGGDPGTWYYTLLVRKWVDPKATRVELSTKPGATTGGQARTETPAEKPTAGGGTYTIKDGDTLSGIAKSYLGDSSRWREIYALNKEIIKNPNLIYPGQTIKLPEGTAPAATEQTSSSAADKKTTDTVPKQSAGASKKSSGKSSGKSKTTANGAPAPAYASAQTQESRYQLPSSTRTSTSTTTRTAATNATNHATYGVRNYADSVASTTDASTVKAVSKLYSETSPYQAPTTKYASKQEAAVASSTTPRTGYTNDAGSGWYYAGGGR